MSSTSNNISKKETFIVSSENLVTNRKHREKWGAKIDSMREALIVTQQGIELINNDDVTNDKDDDVIGVGPFEDALPDISQTSRVEGKEANADTVQLTVKLFLRENDRQIAKQAIHQVEKMLRTEHIHNVYVTVPASDVQFIGMSAHSEDEVVVSSLSEGEAELSDGTARGQVGSQEESQEVNEILDPEREKYAMDLADLWNDLSKIKAVESLGLCDVETDVFKRIYQEAHKKPKNVQVNLKSCCVVPPALKQFAATKKIKLLTHSDSPEILGDNFCNQVAGFGDGKATWRPLWIVRFQIFKELRGILEDRRYIIALERC